MAGLVNNVVPQAKPQDPAKRELPPEVLRVAIAVKKILTQPEIAKRIIAMMQQAGDPATGIAQALVFLLKQVIGRSKNFPKQYALQIAQEVMADIVKLGAAAKLFQPSAELAKQAAMMAAQMFRQEAQKQQPQQQPPAQPAAQPAAAPAEAAMPAAQPMMGV